LRARLGGILVAGDHLQALLPADAASALTGGVRQAVQGAWQRLSSEWGGEEHRRQIDRRDRSEPEWFDLRLMLQQSPFQHQAWRGLAPTVQAFLEALPPGLAVWGRLGMRTAAVFDYPPGDDQVNPVPAQLQEVLFELRAHPILQGLQPDLSQARFAQSGTGQPYLNWVGQEAGRLDQAICCRLLGSANGPEGSQGAGAQKAEAQEHRPDLQEAGPEARGEGPGPLPPKEILALAYLFAHPEWSDVEIARAAGCHRTSLYRWNGYTRARAHLKERKRDRPRGFRSADEEGTGRVDGVDERQPWQDLDGGD